ncbi:related to oxidoreductase [Phialocephala subalpina]|uniref:Related to oxidoreductase n=1 Tax=Phialocephala subalpina TaxID=576137 RepID=A0A1L7XP11_9HELO|nr:related to oxidoreductase [Phialocephala subalpina]
MGGGNEIPKTNRILPVPNSTASYWRSKPHRLDEYRSTEHLPSQADITIIGTGIAGVSTAYHLLDIKTHNDTPPPSILLLEARQVCSGATGRNGGHIKKLPSTIVELIEGLGETAAGEVVKFIRENIYGVKRVIEKEKIEAEAELRRSFDVSLDEEDAREVKREYERELESGFPLTEDLQFVGEEFAERVRIDPSAITSLHGAKAGLSTPVLSLWPYKFVTQLLERVLSKGTANLQTNTAVTAIETHDDDGGYTVTTNRGQVKTPIIVFATNGYTAGLLPQYHNIITPTKATASHITVPANKPAPQYFSNTYNIRYSKNRVDYLNPRPDGSIVIGGGKWTYEKERELWYDVYDDSTLIEPARHYFDGLMQRHFRGWEDSGAETESVWTGIQGVTKDGMPHIGKVPGAKGQYILAGYNGGGNALAFLAARAVARMIREGISFEQTGVPKCMETTRARLDAGKA